MSVQLSPEDLASLDRLIETASANMAAVGGMRDPTEIQARMEALFNKQTVTLSIGLLVFYAIETGHKHGDIAFRPCRRACLRLVGDPENKPPHDLVDEVTGRLGFTAEHYNPLTNPDDMDACRVWLAVSAEGVSLHLFEQMPITH